MLTVALLTGRGNNTLKDKNVQSLLGRPALYYPANAARRTKSISFWYVSSDDEKILNAAEEIGYEKIVRPSELAKPTSQHIDCIVHALEVMRQKGVEPDILVVLLANNITVKSQWIDDCVGLLQGNPHYTAAVPVYEDNDHHPLRAKSVNLDGTLSTYLMTDKPISTNRQDLPQCYFLAHNFWALRTDAIYKHKTEGQPPWTFMGDTIFPYIIEESIDIHKEIDLKIAEKWIVDNYID